MIEDQRRVIGDVALHRCCVTDERAGRDRGAASVGVHTGECGDAAAVVVDAARATDCVLEKQRRVALIEIDRAVVGDGGQTRKFTGHFDAGRGIAEVERTRIVDRECGAADEINRARAKVEDARSAVPGGSVKPRQSMETANDQRVAN